MPAILCVDDEPTQLTLLEFAFKRAGFAVIRAYDGQEAITRALSDKPDIILMDLMMPIKDGATATAEIKATPSLKNIPIVLYTAYDKGDTAKRAQDSGAVGVIRKTIPPSQLVAMINEILDTQK